MVYAFDGFVSAMIDWLHRQAEEARQAETADTHFGR
jgi:hypothetical protein